MEPEGLGGLLGALAGAVAGIADPAPPGPVEINRSAPAEHRPLRFEAPDRAVDVHPGDIVEASKARDWSDRDALSLTFGPDLAMWLAEATTAHVGNPIAVSLCGQQIAAPIVMEPILGGSVQISGALSSEEIDAYLQVIAGRIDCDGQPMSIPDKPPAAPRRPGSRGDQ